MSIRVRIIDRDALAGVAAVALRDYLDGLGWRQVETIANKAAVYVGHGSAGERLEILAPLREDVGDYALRMADAVQTLAEAQGRSELDVLDDLMAVGGKQPEA
jgi:hypothetical protein